MNRTTQYRHTFNGLIHHIYHQQNSRCRRRKKPLPFYSSQELKNWIINNPKRYKLFNKLFKCWVKSDYRLDNRPTIDRINPLKNYSFDNIQILSYKKNVEKGNKELILTKGRAVIMMDLDDKEISKFNSIKEAAINTKSNACNIVLVCRGINKTHKFKKWKYVQ